MKKCGVLLIAAVLATFLSACERDQSQPQVYNDNTTTTQPGHEVQQPTNGIQQPTVTPPPVDAPTTNGATTTE